MAGVKGRVSDAYNKGEAAAKRAKDWSEAQHPTSRPGVLIEAWKRYRDAEGAVYSFLFTAYGLIALLPAALVLSTFIRSDPNALADRLDHRLNLDGATDRLVHEVLAGTSSHKFVALLIAIGSIFISSLGYGTAMQKVCARAWRRELPPEGTHNYVRCQIWFLILLLGIGAIVAVNAAVAGNTWLNYVLAPIWAAAAALFFSWTPGALLERNIPIREALPGGLIIAAGLAILQILSAIILKNWLNWYSMYYGSLGIVLAIFFWILLANGVIVGGTAFGGAYAERRKALRTPPPAPVAES